MEEIERRSSRNSSGALPLEPDEQAEVLQDPDSQVEPERIKRLKVEVRKRQRD